MRETKMRPRKVERNNGKNLRAMTGGNWCIRRDYWRQAYGMMGELAWRSDWNPHPHSPTMHSFSFPQSTINGQGAGREKQWRVWVMGQQKKGPTHLGGIMAR